MGTITITAATAGSLIAMFEQARDNPNTADSPGYAGPVTIVGVDSSGGSVTLNVAFAG